MIRFACVCTALALPLTVRADGAKDNLPDNVRRVPPPGVKVPDADREELEAGLKKYREMRERLILGRVRTESAPDTTLARYLPDADVYYKAVHDALKYDEIFNAKEIPVAKKLLQTALERLGQLEKGDHPWTTQTGVVVRGYRSNIDDSIQPYYVVIPKDYDFMKPIRLDFWCHGRGETLSELNFIGGAKAGEFASDKAIVLNLYGRYCCANKLAGEVDCFEALEAAKRDYKIDENRLVMRGFSMGGAAAWHFAVHYPSMWCAAAPGAGFAETPQFLNVYQNEKVEPTWYEKKLWRMYDCTDWALNLSNLPTIAYSGEIDKQKQAADVMEKAMKAEGLTLEHIIGPKTAHSYEKGAKAELIEKIDKIAEKGKRPVPKSIKFVTYTLRYNQCAWVTIEGLDKHWERAEVDARIKNNEIIVNTKNVSHIYMEVPLNSADLGKIEEVTFVFNGLRNSAAISLLDADNKDVGVAKARFEMGEDGKWGICIGKDSSVRKSPGRQGPIDDAFLSRFVMVRPTGKPMNEQIGKWVDSEMKHAITHWRQQFRGEALQKDDTAITDEDIRRSNLILWGDPSSNAVLKKIADKLPVKWQNGKVVLGEQTFDAGTHMPILIFPNPLNPQKYVVLNSGFTFREYDYLNNARQVPKLPDFAIIDTTTPPNSRYPGKVVEAGFFDERWQVPKK